ncbi:YdcF family protein [uncultured Demequina sp.]|uniref:YdcF family protein n=1 Tax=uncultured Demequina sp. TaxID=693499 RepID=UPI0025FF58F7|nr:YdcF family protein [uncultured Demequina sp.]
MKAWILGAVAAVAVIAIAGLPFYVLPATDQPSGVDVVYVIGPPTDERIDTALELTDGHGARALMVSLDPLAAHAFDDAAVLCDAGATPAGVEVICARPEPFTTRGEARELEAEMAEHGWETSAVITFTPHISRTRMIMERCDVGELSMIASDESLEPWLWAYQYAYQTAGFAKAFVLQGC